MRPFAQKVKESVFIKKINKYYFYFNLIRGQIGKFTSMLNEINFLILIAIALDYDLKSHMKLLTSLVLITCILMTVLGWYFYKSGFYEVEIHVNTNQNPIEKAKYDAAQKVLKSKKI